MGGLHDSLIRGFRLIVAFEGFRAYSFFVNELYGRQEEIVKEPPLRAIESVEEGNNQEGYLTCHNRSTV